MGAEFLFGGGPWGPWLLGALVLAILEALTLQFIGFALALGCLGGAAGSGFGTNWAVGSFAVVTVMALVLSRRLIRTGWLRPRGEPTNLAAVVGARGTVIVPLVAARQEGRVLVQGEDWWAVTANNSDLPLHAPVRVLAIEGSRLVVQPEETGDPPLS